MTNEQRARVAQAIRLLGATKTAEILGLSTEATLRVAGDFGPRAGSDALAAQRLPLLDGASPAPSSAA
jgi:hypothetical protein